MQEEKTLTVQDLIIYFFIGSIIGWILEIIYAYMIFGTFVNRGFLHGPICPIYGFGSVLMILTAEIAKRKNINNVGIFLIIIITFSFLEYITSFFLELIFNLRWWDYTNEFLNLNGRICLMFSAIFGILGIVFIKWIYTPLKKLIKKLKEKVVNKVIWITLTAFILIFIIDLIFSIIKYA